MFLARDLPSRLYVSVSEEILSKEIDSEVFEGLLRLRLLVAGITDICKGCGSVHSSCMA